MHVLQAIYFRFRRNRETADQTHGREAGLPVDSAGGARLQKVKGTLFAAPILANPQPGERLIFDTDASNFGNGGVLSQVKDGQERVIAYYSKTLNKAE
jgi:hypothetical protein